MYFLIDAADHSVTAFKKNGDAARAALRKMDVSIKQGEDPVALSKDILNDRMVILNLSGAFESISESDDGAAQELAAGMKSAIDALYQ